jgi:SAM-dependent methyltransferase
VLSRLLPEAGLAEGERDLRGAVMRRPCVIARQSWRPSGWLGGIIGRVMAHETASTNRVALDLLRLDARDAFVELGFGHGATLAKAAEIITRGFLAGVDHSEVMLRMASRANAALIKSGRMELMLADSARIPYPDGRFSKVLAVHTIYFWAEPGRHLREIHRVMSAGGRLVLGYCPAEDARFARDFPSSVYAIRSVGEIETILRQSGLRLIGTATKAGRGGLMAWTVAEKASR